MNIWAGEILRVLKADVTGNGWVTARRGLDVGDEGLVPEGFLDFASQNTLPADGGSGTFVVCTFDFPPPNHTLGPGQACIRKHQLYELSDEGFGFDADWVELIVPKGSDGGRIRGIVPKSYVRPV
jgi:hypothetical protein